VYIRTLPINIHSSKRLDWKCFSDSSSEKEDPNSLEVDLSEFAEMVKSQQNGGDRSEERLVVDVREPEELVESGGIPGAINIPRNNVWHGWGCEETG